MNIYREVIVMTDKSTTSKQSTKDKIPQVEMHCSMEGRYTWGSDKHNEGYTKEPAKEEVRQVRT
jgi:hypothetical protein